MLNWLTDSEEFMDKVDQAKDVLREEKERKKAQKQRLKRRRERVFEPVHEAVQEILDAGIWLKKATNWGSVSDHYSFEKARDIGLIGQPEIHSLSNAQIPHPDPRTGYLFLTADHQGGNEIECKYGGKYGGSTFRSPQNTIDWLAEFVAKNEEFRRP